jgi:hypothetical protein
MFLFLGLGLIELAVFSVFFILLVVATAFDRREVEAPKWWLIGLSLAALAAYHWPEFTFFGPGHVDAVVEGGKEVTKAVDRVVLWDVVSHFAFWVPLLWYFGVGVGYSFIEFLMTIRRAERRMSTAWQAYIGRKVTVPLLDGTGQPIMLNESGTSRKLPATKQVTVRELLRDYAAGDSSNKEQAVEAVEKFVRSPRDYEWYGASETQIIKPFAESGSLDVMPKINKAELVDHISAWTFLWPAYAVSLIIGDMLAEIFRAIGDFFVSISGRLVRTVFADTFKV